MTSTQENISEQNETRNLNKNNHSDGPVHQDNDESEKIEPDKSKVICRFFRNRKCKHGIKGIGCKFTHPKICSKFTQHGTRQPRGCKLGKKCPDFHPKMCINSLRKGECFDESCKFSHVKGTQRHPPVTLNKQAGRTVNGSNTTNQARQTK